MQQIRVLKRINHNIHILKLFLLIIIIFQSCILFQAIHQQKTTETIQPTQKADILENLSQPPKLIPELEGIDLQTIINAESI